MEMESKFFDNESPKDIWIKTFSPCLETNIKFLLDLNIEIEPDPFKICFGFTQKEKIQMYIEKCKSFLSELDPNSSLYKSLVQKIIQLKIAILNINETEDTPSKNIFILNGHSFTLKSKIFKERNCERCNNIIIPLYHQYLLCINCNYVCHTKCSSSLNSQCTKAAIKAHPSYILAIKPETGLINQDFKCADCKATFDLDKPTLILNICDYSGLVYCDLCYKKKDSMPIPARILHNWDFKPRGVSKTSKHYLELMKGKPVLSLVDINPSLFAKVPSLQRLSKLRKNLLYIKIYLTTCKSAIKHKMLLKLSHRQHFIENSDMYSLQDLLDLQQQILLPEISLIYNSYIIHIKQSCQICQAKGFICEHCSLGNMIFPFDENVSVCPLCMAVYHKTCFEIAYGSCPRCKRRKLKKSKK